MSSSEASIYNSYLQSIGGKLIEGFIGAGGLGANCCEFELAWLLDAGAEFELPNNDEKNGKKDLKAGEG